MNHLAKYLGKPSKSVILLSTVHATVFHDRVTNKLPECVTYLNNIKSVVDNVDQMSRLHITKLSCRRWHLQGFHNVFDLAVIYSLVYIFK